MNHEFHDILIVGAGPAGMTAGLYAVRARMNALVLERGIPGGQLLNTLAIEDYPGFRQIGGFELAQKMEEHARSFGCAFATATVERIRLESYDGVKLWIAETAEKRNYAAPALILTAGGTPNKLAVPGEEKFLGRGVSYCAVCDAHFFRDRVVAVVGGGTSALEEAAYLARFASKVYVVHRRDTFRAQSIAIEHAWATPNLEFILDSVVKRIEGNEDGVTHLILQGTRAEDGQYSFGGVGDERKLVVDGVFIFIGFSPNVHLLAEHAKHDAEGHLITDHRMETSLPGLFAAGDVRSQLIRQISTAVGDATTAAVAAERYVTELRARGLLSRILASSGI